MHTRTFAELMAKYDRMVARADDIENSEREHTKLSEDAAGQWAAIAEAYPEELKAFLAAEDERDAARCTGDMWSRWPSGRWD